MKTPLACMIAACLTLSAEPDRFVSCATQATAKAVKAAPAVPVATRFGPGGAFQVEYEIVGGTSLQSRGVIARLDAKGGTKFYPLPQSSFETYAKLRPKDLTINPLSATANNYERLEIIGPHQVEGGRLWFGNNFYDGEGERGVGAFGCFDTSTRHYSLFSPPEVAAYEVSSILVERDVVWVALDHAGEGFSTSGGLIRWNTATHRVRGYPLEFVVNRIAREGDSLRLTTSGGYALVTNDVVHRFRVTGAMATPIDRFPPPPSKDEMQ